MSRTAWATLAAAMLVGGGPAAASAQLADGPKQEQQASLFLLRSDTDRRWVGGVTSKGTQDLGARARVRLLWQLDYGTLGAKRVSPGGTTTGDETTVSKNTGVLSVGHSHEFGGGWRWAVDAGAEHKRTMPPKGGDGVEHHVAPIAVASLRHVGARLLGRNPDTAPELAWSVQPALSSARALLAGGKPRRLFLDPVAVAWLSLWATPTAMPSGRTLLRYRVQLRGEAALMRSLDAALRSAAHYDASLTYFFSPSNGITLRRFAGYFDHNLRDRKRATTVNLVWKFK